MSMSSRRERRRVIVGREGSGGNRLLSLGRPYLAVVSAPSAPLPSRVLTDSRVLAAARRGPWLLALLAAASLPVLTLLGMRSSTDDALLVAAATTIIAALVTAPLSLVLYGASEVLTPRLDAAHERVLARLPGVVVGGEDPSVAHALGRLRALRTPASRAYVERLLGATDVPRATTLLVLLAVTAVGGTGIDGTARRRGERELADELLRLANALPLDAEYDSLVLPHSRGASPEERLASVRRGLSDLEAGLPWEWVLRRASVPVVGS